MIVAVTDAAAGCSGWRATTGCAAARPGCTSSRARAGPRTSSAPTPRAPRWPSTTPSRSTAASTTGAPSSRGAARPRRCTTRSPAPCSAPSTSPAATTWPARTCSRWCAPRSRPSSPSCAGCTGSRPSGRPAAGRPAGAPAGPAAGGARPGTRPLLPGRTGRWSCPSGIRSCCCSSPRPPSRTRGAAPPSWPRSAIAGDAAAVTVRAELSRLRRLIGADLVGSRPYRLRGRIETDLDQVRRLLARGAVGSALERYPGRGAARLPRARRRRGPRAGGRAAPAGRAAQPSSRAAAALRPVARRPQRRRRLAGLPGVAATQLAAAGGRGLAPAATAAHPALADRASGMPAPARFAVR